MESSLYQRWLRQVYDTQEKEFACSELFERLAEYVEREIAGERVAETMPQMKHTLDVCRDQCRACYELYLTLRGVASLEQTGRLSLLDDPHTLF